MSPGPGAAGALQTPALARRLACFAYEGVLLFGVLMAAGLVYAVTTQQEHALAGVLGLQAFVFVVLGTYFVGFWSRTGQTLAMQTWHIRLLTRAGEPVTVLRALGRYVLCWLWFLPALAVLYFSGVRTGGASVVGLAAGVLVYAALSWLHPQRQYWHDAICGTRLVTWQPRPEP